jgi:sugar lactone lactonase YvrE
MLATNRINRTRTSRASSLFALAALFLLSLAAASPANAQNPAVVFSYTNGVSGVCSSPSLLYAGGCDYAGTVDQLAANARGDVFASVSENNVGYILEVPANGSQQVQLLTGLGNPYGANSVYVDKNNNIYVPNASDANVVYIPFVNGAYAENVNYGTLSKCSAFPVPATTTTDCIVPLNYPGSLGYYVSAGALGMDGAGNLYMISKYCGGGCVASGTDILFEVLASNGNFVILDSTLGNDSGSEIAVNNAGDIFITNYGSLYEYKHSANTTRISAYSQNGPDGVQMDASGNLYVTENSAAEILEYPYIDGDYGLPGGNSFIVSNQLGSGYTSQASQGIAVAGSGKITYAGNYPNSLSTLTVGNLAFGSTPINTTSGSSTLNMVFNTAETFGSIKTFGPFNATTTCTAASYAAGGNCTVSVTYSSNAVGTQTGELVAYSSTGTVLGTAFLSGVGTGATVNADPGTDDTDGTGYTMPAAVAVDSTGNIFVADSSTGNIYKTTTSSTAAAAVVASGFTAPSAIAVDGADNLYVAASGEVVEAAYNATAATYGTPTVLFSGLSGPSGLALDSIGNVYIADSGNSRVVRLASSGGLPLGSQFSTLGTGLATPVALAIDNASQNIYIADAGAENVVQVNLLTSSQATILSGLTTAAGVSVDPSGSLYSVDSGKDTVTRVPFENGGLNPNAAVTLASIVATPNAIAADNQGNLYVADTADAVVATDLRSAGLVNFGNVTVGQQSGIVSGVVSNGGNSSFTLSSPDYTQSGDTSSFAIQSSSTCAAGNTLTSGQSCTLSAIFSPQTYGPLTDTLALASTPATGTTLAFTGNGSPVLIDTTLKLAVTSSGTPTFGQPTTITATLTPASQASAVPTGTITFVVNGVTVNPPTKLNAAGTSASITVSLNGGSNTITASYSGDYFYASTSSSPLTVAVKPSTTTTTLSISAPDSNPTAANPSTAKSVQTVTLTATVTPPASGTPTGTVTFYNGTTVLGTANVVPYSPTTKFSEGQATLAVNTAANPLPLGTYSITATYSGDSNYGGSSTATASPLLISNASVVLSASASSIVGGSGTLTLTVVPVAGFVGAADFTCSGLPAYSTCSFNPAYVDLPSGATSASVTFSVAINQPPAIAVPGAVGGLAHLPGRPALAAFLTLFLLLPTLLLAYARRSQRAAGSRFSTMRLTTLIAFVLLTGCAAALSGCGTGSATFNTPAGTTNITVGAVISGTGNTAPTPASTVQIQLNVP